MTAVVGILNKQGVAIAADSAVTVNGHGNRKVYNSANKIFTLSKYHPVGIAIYNSAQIMGIPWEILIKEYRKQLGQNSFSTLADYKDDFFKFLADNRYFLETENNNYLFSELLEFVQMILNHHLFNAGMRGGTNPNDLIKQQIEHYKTNEQPKYEILTSLNGIDEIKIKQLLGSMIPEVANILSQNFGTVIDKSIFETELTDVFYSYLHRNHFVQYTGLIFTGYGDKEIYPRLITVNCSLVIDSKLRFFEDKKKEAIISDQPNSCIRPFAQTDVIDTILQGISPELGDISRNVFGDFIVGFIDTIKTIPGMPSKVISSLNTINPVNYVNDYMRQMSTIINHKYVSPLMGAVSQLSKEDLAEMAESLVYLTYLKRRFTMAEESVGGPVDIAVITKGDGFIWIKRKHYFNPELNQSFFQKYF